MKHLLKSNKVVLEGKEYADLLATIQKQKKELREADEYRNGFWGKLEEFKALKKTIENFMYNCHGARLSFGERPSEVFYAKRLKLVVHKPSASDNTPLATLIVKE